MTMQEYPGFAHLKSGASRPACARSENIAGSAHLKSSASRPRRSPETTAPDLFARYFDDLEVGDSFTTKGRTITEADLVNFAALTWDTYPLHVDAEWASKTMFGERIAHGMLVLSYAAGLVPMQPGPIVAFYGMEKVRFFAPTKIGDTIRVHVELKEKEERDENLGLATFHQAVVNQRDETVCKSINKVILKRRP